MKYRRAFNLCSSNILLLVAAVAVFITMTFPCPTHAASSSPSFLNMKNQRKGIISKSKNQYHQMSTKTNHPDLLLDGSIPRGGAVKKSKNNSMSKHPAILNPKLIFTFMGIGTASFGIPSIIVPEFTHNLLSVGDFPGTFPASDSFYYYMFAVREVYLATTFLIIGSMINLNDNNSIKMAKTWQKFALFILATQMIINIFHNGWNPNFQPFIIIAHTIPLIWNLLSLVYY